MILMWNDGVCAWFCDDETDPGGDGVEAEMKNVFRDLFTFASMDLFALEIFLLLSF
jgi:hypothetical protein